MSALQDLCSKCRFCLRIFLCKKKNERFHVKYKFTILWDFDFMILRFYVRLIFMCNLQFSYFQRLEVDVNQEICYYIFCSVKQFTGAASERISNIKSFLLKIEIVLQKCFSKKVFLFLKLDCRIGVLRQTCCLFEENAFRRTPQGNVSKTK